MTTSSKATETENLAAKYLGRGEERRAFFGTKHFLRKLSDPFYNKTKVKKLKCDLKTMKNSFPPPG